MSFSESHNVSRIEAVGKGVVSYVLSASLLTKTFAFLPVILGLLFILTGGIKALFGLVMLAFGVFYAINSRKVTITPDTITLSPAFPWLKMSKPERSFKRPAQFDVTNVKGDFSFSSADFRFFPLNATRISAQDDSGQTVTLGYVNQHDAQYFANVPASDDPGVTE